MSSVTELADQLGKAIGQSAQALALRQARKDLSAQPEVLKAMQDYQAQAEKVAHLEHEQKPIEPEDKQKIQSLQEKMLSYDVFKKFTAAQVEYVDMMRQVNETIRRHLASAEAQ